MAVISVGRGQTLLDKVSYSTPLNNSTSTRLHLRIRIGVQGYTKRAQSNLSVTSGDSELTPGLARSGLVAEVVRMFSLLCPGLSDCSDSLWPGTSLTVSRERAALSVTEGG